MTNTRRKTFPDPLSFWQWAIMEPGLRKAKAPKPSKSVFFVKIDSVGRGELCGSWPTLVAENFPLTAVEDEHGAIEEEKSGELPMLANWAGYSLYSAMLPETSDDARIEKIRLAVSYLLQEATRIADERIAAATVKKNWCGDFVIKPKGDA